MQGGCPMQKKKRKNTSKTIWMGILLILVFYVLSTLYQQQQELKHLKQQEMSSLQEIEKIQQDIDILNQQLEVSNDDQYIEKIARQQLKMIGSNEIMVIDIGEQ